jgi:hypothetical protein
VDNAAVRQIGLAVVSDSTLLPKYVEYIAPSAVSGEYNANVIKRQYYSGPGLITSRVTWPRNGCPKLSGGGL